MSTGTSDNSISAEDDLFYNLRLFVAGTSPASARAITNLKLILDEHLKGKYELDVVDIHQQPELAERSNITAVPMMEKTEPTPKRLLVGDMSNKEKVMRGLGLSDIE